jgi:hypothetical protein
MPQVTAGHTWVDDETVTYAKLRLAAVPSVALTSADHTAIANNLAAAVSNTNYLQNSDFRDWSTTTISLPATWTVTASNWYAKGTYSPGPSTGATVARSADAVHNHVIYCASITGEANATSVNIGQRLSSSIAAALLEDKATLTIELENKTGTSQTPTLVWETCDVMDDFSAVTQQTTATLGAVAANERKTITLLIDLSSYITATRRGGIMSVQLPGLNSASKEWRVYYSRLEPGQIASPRRIPPVSSATAATTASDPANYFENASFAQWLVGEAAFKLAVEDANNYYFSRWGVTPSDGGTTCLVTRVASAPDTRSKYAVQVTGDPAATGTTDVHQFLFSHMAAHLLAETLNVSWWVYNNTGASFTPQLRIDTCSGANNMTFTNRLAQSMQACPSGAWTRVTLSFTPASYTNWTNGAKISLRFPTGTLDSGAKSVRVAQAQLIRGTAPVTFWSPPVTRGPIASTARTATGLAITRDSVTTCTAAVSEAVCVSRDGLAVVCGSIPATNVTHGSALTTNQHYHIRLACDETGKLTPFSHLWSVDPWTVAPDAFISGVVGCFTTNGSSQIDEFSQRGHQINITPAVMLASTVTASYTQIGATPGFDKIPAIVTAIRGTFGTSSGVTRGSLAATSSGLGEITFGAGTTTTGVNSFTTGAIPFYLPLSTSQTVWVKADSVTPALRIVCTGLELP